MKKTKLTGVALSLMIASSAIAKNVTLEVTAWKGNEAEPAGFGTLLPKFHAENPNIKIELNYISRGDTNVVLPPRLQSGKNAPDIMMVDMPLVKVWGDAGLLKDLGTDSSWFNNVLPSIKNSLISNNALYVQPIEVVGLGNFVNLDLLAKAGISEPPKTIDDLLTACQKLDAKGIVPMLFSAGLSGSMFVVANGIDLSDAEPWALGSGQSKFADNQGFNKSLDITRQLIDANCFDPKLQAGLDPWTTSLTEFRSGNVAMLPQGAWNMKAFDEQEGLNYVFTSLPSNQTTGIALDTFAMGWAISSTTKHSEEAQLFLDFFSRDENLAILLKEDSGYSPYSNGTSGLSSLAQGYNDARDAGNIVMWPVYMNHWPATMEAATIDGVASLLLKPSMDNEDILEVWDEVVEDSL
ncbi:extracellular solute-binding protein [Marinomonas agarivorans]|nr:extracellular solute-binding protein [Marinomonas agarivorans]